MTVDVQDMNAANRTEADLSYEGLGDGGDWGPFVDPSYFLDKYLSDAGNNCTGWRDKRYDAMVAEANSTLDRAERLRKQAECERYALRSMPMLPLWYNTWSYLQKPFVRGLPPNLLDLRLFQRLHRHGLEAAMAGRISRRAYSPFRWSLHGRAPDSYSGKLIRRAALVYPRQRTAQPRPCRRITAGEVILSLFEA
jgi:hypothetical protein